ncbi:MAG: SH3 domain-containing protein [Rhodomicrobiaceae bacterium]
MIGFIKIFIVACAVLTACGANIARADSDNQLRSYFQRLFGSVAPKTDRYPLVRLKNDGRAFALHLQPNNNALIAARLQPPTRFVQFLGRCTPNWCYVRLGTAIGWLGRDRLLDDPSGPPVARTVAIEERVSKTAATEEIVDNNQESPLFADIPLPVRKSQPPLRQTASLLAQAPAPDDRARGPERQEVSHTARNTYALTEIYGRVFMPVQKDPDGTSQISGKIPFFARDIEALGQCFDGWCLIRRGAVQGWIRQRHLTDGPGVIDPRLQLEEVMPLDVLNVYSAPTKEASVVATINRPATDIRPLETCNEDWCNVRYLDTVGWVDPRYLTRQ